MTSLSSFYLLPVSSPRPFSTASSSLLSSPSSLLFKSTLQVWFGSEIGVGIPVYAICSCLPLLHAYQSSWWTNKNKQQQQHQQRQNKNPLAESAFESAHKKKQISVLGITWIDIVSSIAVTTGLSCLLNRVAAAATATSGVFLKAWAFQNNYNGRLRGYFIKNLLEKFFVSRRISDYFYAPDPSEEELKHILFYSRDSSSPISFNAVFEDHLKRNAIESVARASSISIGLALLLVPSIRKVLRPAEAVFAEQPHLLASTMLAAQNKARQVLDDEQQEENDEDDQGQEQESKNESERQRPRSSRETRQKSHQTLQMEFIEEVITPTFEDTMTKIRWTWIGEMKVLLVNAAVSGLVRRYLSDSAAVEFWVGNYATFVCSKIIDVMIVFGTGGA